MENNTIFKKNSVILIIDQSIIKWLFGVFSWYLSKFQGTN